MLESALQKLSSHYLSVIEFLKCYFLKTNEKNKNNYNSKKTKCSILSCFQQTKILKQADLD